LCGFGVDSDSCAVWLNSAGGPKGVDAAEISRGMFCSGVGIDRLLMLFDKYNIKTTWFCPAHSIETFPEQHAKVRDAGHELGLHNYTHELPILLSVEQEKDVLVRSIDVLQRFTGKKPRGYTAPGWTPSKNTVKLLEELGVEYDHSFMAHDCQIFYAPDFSDQDWIGPNFSQPAGSWMSPLQKFKASSIPCVPASVSLDDWPALCASIFPEPRGFTDTYVVEKQWIEQFDFFYEHYDEFVFPMSIHPQCSGKPHVYKMLCRIIDYINQHEGVEWVTFGEMVDEFKAGRLPEFKINGGAE